MPAGVWLSVATVIAMAIGRIVVVRENIGFKEFARE